jgi:hypothetical protein
MIFPGESAEAAMRPESVWRRLDRPEGATPDEYELIRVAAYKFQSLYAERWRVGRVFLAGDAAHQMPPFLAQGLCSGFRDAYNLAWKLDLVLQGVTPPDFLDTYMAERGPNARATIVESMRVGQHVNERDPEKVRKRDAELMALQDAKEKAKLDHKPQLIAFRAPGFSAGFTSRLKGSTSRGAGDAFIQGKVRHRGREGLFDDVVGRGFMIVSRKGDPAAALPPGDCYFWCSLGGIILRITHAISRATLRITHLRQHNKAGEIIIDAPQPIIDPGSQAGIAPKAVAAVHLIHGGGMVDAIDGATAIEADLVGYTG